MRKSTKKTDDNKKNGHFEAENMDLTAPSAQKPTIVVLDYTVGDCTTVISHQYHNDKEQHSHQFFYPNTNKTN